MSSEIKTLQGNLRLNILALYKSANAGHIGCSLSCIDLMIAVFKDNKKKDEQFILSKGHAAVSIYAMLNQTGEISDELLNTYYKNGTVLTAHPAPNKFPGIPFATGSLGHGFPFAAGIAMANKLQKNNLYTYVLMSDGETNEGTTWEAAHFAKSNKLDNLIVIVDKNGLQGFGNTTDILGDTSTPEQWESMGFEVVETDGHEVEVNQKVIGELKKSKNGKPKVIIASTCKGKGVSFMENKLEWHYLPMNDAHYQQALTEINSTYLS